MTEEIFNFSFDQEIEEALLGALMIDDEAIIRVVDILKPEDFSKKENQIIYQAILDLFEKRIGIDLITVNNYFKEKKLLDVLIDHNYLVYLINKAPSALNVVSYAKLIKTKKAKRDLLELSLKIKELVETEDYDAEELIDEVEKRIFSIAEKVYPYEFLPISSLLEESKKRIEDLQRGIILRGVPTGFQKLDEYLGGLQKSDLIILASRPSQGKTALALNIARYLAVEENIPVGIFSLEMSKDQIIDRLIASQAGISLWRLRTGRLLAEGDVDELVLVYDAIEKLKTAPIFIDDSPSLNNLQIRTMSRKLKHEIGELGLLVIDYLQLIRSSRLIENRVQEVSEISKSLKELARELEVPVLAISQLSRAPEQRISQIPRLSDLRESGCLTGDTLILNAETGEYLSMKELLDKKLSIKVLTIDENYKIVSKKLIKVFPSGKKMVYLLKTKTGREIKASANHPFRTIFGWTALENLKIGDKIAIPREINLDIKTSSLTDEEVIFLAHMIGDGCYVKKQPIHYTSSDFEAISLMVKLAQQLFNIQPRIVQQKNWWHVYFPSPYRLSRKKHHPIVNWLRNLELDFARSYEKKLPVAIFQIPETQLALFLHHLWSTDGNISSKKLKGRKPSASIYYSTTSEILARQIQSLLLRLGIQSYLKTTKKRNYRLNYWVIIYGKENILKFLRNVGCFGIKGKIIPQLLENIEKIKPHYNNDLLSKEVWHKIINPARINQGISQRQFAQMIQTAYCGTSLFKSNLSRERLLKIAQALNDEYLKNLAESQVYWDEIIEIKPLLIEDVYDAEVEDTHNFLANDIFVHNSLEQDSDVVLFIHRPKEGTMSLPSNQVNVIIAKHRNGPIGSIDLYFDPDTVSFYTLETQPEEIEFH